MAVEPTQRYEIPYSRLFPWVRLFRGVALASDGKKLILAALGLVLLHVGWWCLDGLFPRSRAITPDVLGSVVVDGSALRPSWDLDHERGVAGVPLRTLLVAPAEPLRWLSAPFLGFFGPWGDAWAFLHASLAALWAVVVWGIVGVAIARIAVAQVARSRRVGLVGALRHSARRWGAAIGAPLLPLTGIFFFAALCAAFGLLYRFPHPIGARVAGLFAFLPLLGGLAMAVILIGLAAGWPLMHAAVAAEGEDGLDALSRSFAYVYHRPWNYLGYALLAWAVGVVGWLLVGVFVSAVIQLARWGLSFGASGTSFDVLFGLEAGRPDPAAAAIHGLWFTVVALLAHGWLWSYFWTSAATIYLLLRHDVDGTPWRAIDLEEEASPSFAQEPNLSVVSKETAETTVST